jgi:hypothetical protein
MYNITLSHSYACFNFTVKTNKQTNKQTNNPSKGPPAEYLPYLKLIVNRLKQLTTSGKTKLLFAITSPDLCNKPIDDIQVQLNAQAATLMAAEGIPTVDLYKAITGKIFFWLPSFACGFCTQACCFFFFFFFFFCGMWLCLPDIAQAMLVSKGCSAPALQK